MSADEFDRASDLEIAQTESNVAKVRNLARPEQERVDGKWPSRLCVDCEETIPTKRLNLGKIRCIHCQEVLERRRAGR